jgi:hypothetical protein
MASKRLAASGPSTISVAFAGFMSAFRLTNPGNYFNSGKKRPDRHQ